LCNCVNDSATPLVVQSLASLRSYLSREFGVIYDLWDTVYSW